MVRLWAARVAWILLPLVAGGALADALDPWSSAPAAVAAALAWLAWLAGLVTLLAPRPWGFTVLRVVAPGLAAAAVAAAWSPSPAVALVAVAGAALALGLALSAPVAAAAADAVAYGPEQRFALRAPLLIAAAPLPIAVALIVAGVSVGPIALADRRWALGAAASVIGLPLAAVLSRAVHQLDRRWLVLVPAGLVVVDPLTLVDPVLLPRERVRAVAIATAATEDDPTGLLDLRLGSLAGSVYLTLSEPGMFGRRSGRTGATTVEARAIALTPLQPRLAIPRSRAHLQRRTPAL